MRRPGGGASGRAMGPMIPEVDEEDFEDLQLYPFDEPTDEDVLWMAQLLGIHPIKDKQLLYLAEEALINPPSQEWMIFKDIAGNVIWINDVTEEMEPHPPHLEELIENVMRQKRRLQEQEARGSSQDKTSAMKKLLGRHLPSHELTSGNDEPMSGSRTAGSNTSTQLGGLLGNKYAPLPAKPGPATPQSTQSNRKPAQDPPKQSQEPPKPVGGKMNLMKALEASRQVAPEPEPPVPAKGGKGAASAANNRQTSASTAATNSKPQSGVTHNRNGGKAFPPADESGEEFNMDDYKEDEGEEEQEDDGDSVFDKRLGGAPEVDGEDDDEDGDQNSSPSDDESEEDRESGYGQKGVVIGEADPNLDEEEDQSEDVEYPVTREVAPPPKAQASSKPAVGNRPTSAAQKPNNSSQQPKKEVSKPSNTSKPKEKPQNRKPTKTGNNQASEDQNSLLLSQLLTDFQQMKQKVSKLEMDNQDLKNRNEKLEQLQSTISTPKPVGGGSSPGSTPSGGEDHNIKSGIAEIKKLLEQSILIQNNTKDSNEHHRGSETKPAEENRSMVMGATADMSRGGIPIGGFDQTMSSPHYLMSATFPTNMQSAINPQVQQSQRPMGMGLPQMPNYSLMMTNEIDSKWSSLIGREREKLQSVKLSLQNEKLTLENRKLSLKKHEFEMRKEMQGIKLEDGHPLASKIRDNIHQQKNFYKNGVCIWRDRCAKHNLKQKSLNMLEKSYMFAKSSGSSWDAADKHLEELYSAYCLTDEETTAELKDHPEDELLSEDSQGMGLDSESERMFDDTHSKSEKVSSTDTGMNGNRLGFDEPTKYKYNLEEIRRSINQPYSQTGSSWYPGASQVPGYSSMLQSREGIRSYFQQNSKFYSSMRKEFAKKFS